MSSSEDTESADRAEDTLDRATVLLAAAIENPDAIPDEAFRRLFAEAVRLYGAKAERGGRVPFPAHAAPVGVDDVMIVATDILHAANVQVFELSMWQAMTGNCIDPNRRADANA
jgi:hypothetical protein